MGRFSSLGSGGCFGGKEDHQAKTYIGQLPIEGLGTTVEAFFLEDKCTEI